MHYRSDIDGLRSIAILPVVLFHADLGIPGGFIGVDIFFVISGYLLAGIILEEVQEHRFSFAKFYERRFRRLMPALFFLLAVMTAAFSRIMLPGDFVAFGKTMIATVLVSSNFYFYATTDYFSEAANLIPLLHTWSLAIEEQFYLFLPAFLLLTRKSLGPKGLRVMLWLVFLLSLALCIHYTFAHKPKGFYMPYTRTWELLAGTLLNVLPPPRAGMRRALNLIGTLALAGLAVMFITFDERDAFPGYMALGPVLATAVLIHGGGLADRPWANRLLQLPPLVFIGKISYSLYLWHWPILVFANYGDLAPESLTTKLICVGLSVAMATLSWRFVEEPFRRKRLLPSTRSCIAATATGAALMIAAALAVIHGRGFPDRLPANLLALLQKDRYETARPDCFPASKEALVAAPCLRGDSKAAPSFLLIGDSHAHALSPALFGAASTAGMAGLQFTSAGFLPGPGRALIGGGEDSRIGRARQLVETTPQVCTIVLAGAWSDYATGENWKGKRWLYQDVLGTAATSQENAPIFERALARFVAAYPDRKILLLDDVPAGRELDLNAHVRRALTHPAESGQSFLPAAKVAKRRQNYDAILSRIAAAHPNTSYIRVFGDFCATGDCPLFNGGIPVFRDGDHLSQQGALMWQEAFASKVLPAIRAANGTCQAQTGSSH